MSLVRADGAVARVDATLEDWRRRADPVLRRPAALWLAFAVVHLAVLGIALWRPGRSVGDLNTYWQWVSRAWTSGYWPVIDTDWVYPVGALPPMVVASLGRLLGGIPGYVLAWFAIVTLLNVIAVRALLRTERGLLAAWWWTGFVLLLGPVAIGRVDGLVVPLVVIALLQVFSRPRASAALLAVGAWIKVFPGFLLLPLAVASRRPFRDVVAPVLGVCAVVVATVTALGGGGRLLSFLNDQGARGLQLESVAATPWMLVGLVSSRVQRGFNKEIITYEVTGWGTSATAAMLDAVLILGVAACAFLLVRWRVRHGRRFWAGLARTDLVLRGSLLVVAMLLVTNKVLSPQFIGWLAAPVAVAIAVGARGWRHTALSVWAIALATQIVFPWGYLEIVRGGGGLTLVLVARNVAVVCLLVASVRWFWRVPDLRRDTRESRGSAVRSSEPADDAVPEAAER